MKKKIEKIKKMKLWILPAPVILILAVMALGGVGFVGALNGWFGGGSAIPSDTFTRGLVGYWSFDESKGTTVYDSSGNSKNGTLNPCGGGTDNGNGTCTSTITWQVGASADDVSVAERNGAWNFEGLTDTWFFAGFYSSPALLKAGSGGRFLNVTIPQGATINSAVVKLTANGSSEPGSVTVNTRFIGEKVANAATFSTLADYQARRGTVVGGANNNYITSAQVDWDSIPVWTLDTEYTSPEVKTIIQEIVNQGTWSSGNALVLWWDDYDNRSTNSLYRFRNAYAYDGSAVKAAKLVMTYTYTLPSSWTTANPPTGGGSALKFDGAGNYVSAGNVYNGVKSVEFWVKADNTTKKILDLNGSAYVEVSNQTITATGWTSPTIYVNGVKNSTTISTSTWAHVIITTDTAIDASTVDLGRVSTGYFPGTLDEVRFYSRSLSDSEVRYHYNRGGPVAQWKFDEGEGRTVYDSTDNNNDGTLVLAGSATSSAWVAGKYGSALSFDGVDDYVDAGNVSSNARTVSFWLKRGNTSDKDVIDLGTPEIKISSNAITSTGLTSPTYYIDGVRATTIADTNWHHITITDTADISASNVDIGKASSNYFLGLIDDVKIYNYARTPDEIRLDYNAGFAALFGPQTGCDQDPGSCMTQGLVGYWPMEEGSGSVAHDSSNYGNNGSSTMASWTKGKVGSALDLDGAGDYISIPDNDIFDPSGDFTLSIWTKQDTFGGAGYWERSFIAHDTVGGVAVKWVFAHDGTKTAFDFIPPSLAIYELRSDAWTLSAGVWYQISVTRQGSTFTFYKDGVANGTVTNAVALGNNAQPLTIGWAEANKAYDGIIDEVRIYNRALSASEVRYHYNRGAPVAQWKFDEGNGAKVYDSTDNKNGAIRSSALNFDGVNDYVAIPDSNDWNFGSGDFTIETWAKFRSVAGTQNFVSQWGDSGSNGSFAFVLDVGATLMFFWSTTGSSELRVDGAWSPSINTWYYVTAIRSGTSIKTYVDTVEKGSGTLSGTIYNSTRNLDIGAYRDAGQIFNGLIDDVRIYNRALSVTEMQEHYKGKYANETGLMLNVPFNNEAGYTVTDYSGRGNNGTASSTFADMTAGYGDANTTGWAIDTSWQAGKYGNALKFGGANGFFQTNNSVTSTSAFSYSLWFKSGKGSYSANQYLFSQGDDDPSAYIGTNGKLNVMADNALKITSSKTVLDTNWHHVQVTADGSNLKLYLDGGFEGSIGYTGSSEDAGFTAGADIYRNNFFNGYIDDVKIYNYARTPDEIRLDYNAGFAALFGPQTGCDQDPGSCMTQGLVGYWPMEEGSGNIAYDASNYAYNATTSGTAPNWTKGKVGGGLSFDGTDDLIQTSATVSFNSNNIYTAEAWIYPTASGDPKTFLSFGSSASGNQYVDEFSLRNLNLQFANYAGSWTASAGALSLNTWNHAVLIHDGANNNVKIYLNGVLGVDASYTTDLLTTTGAITAGALNTVTPGEYFAGRVDEVRIYNRALSAAEVRYHYNKGGPVAQWKFDEGEGTTAYDSTDNNNDGTLTSGPAWVAGKYGSALSFDGVNDYVSVADNNSLDITSAITISAWINPTKTGANRQVIVSKRVAQTNSSNYQFYIFGGEAGKVNFYNGVAEYEFNYAPPSNTWTHLVMTLDGTTGKLYANGALKDTKIFSFGAANAAPLTIGYFDHSTTDEIFSGFIDDVRIYNYVRTTEQIRQDYNAGLSTHFK